MLLMMKLMKLMLMMLLIETCNQRTTLLEELASEHKLHSSSEHIELKSLRPSLLPPKKEMHSAFRIEKICFAPEKIFPLG